MLGATASQPAGNAEWTNLQAAVSTCMQANFIECLGCRVSMSGVCIKQVRSPSRWRGSPIKIIFDKGYRLLKGRARQADTECIAAKTACIVFGIACCTTKLHHQSHLARSTVGYAATCVTDCCKTFFSTHLAVMLQHTTVTAGFIQT